MQLKIYMDLNQICQVVSAANMFRLSRSKHILTEGQIMSFLLFKSPMINVVKEDVGKLHSDSFAACADLDYNSLTSAECLNHQGKIKIPVCASLNIYSSETDFYKYWNTSCQVREWHCAVASSFCRRCKFKALQAELGPELGVRLPGASWSLALLQKGCIDRGAAISSFPLVSCKPDTKQSVLWQIKEMFWHKNSLISKSSCFTLAEQSGGREKGKEKKKIKKKDIVQFVLTGRKQKHTFFLSTHIITFNRTTEPASVLLLLSMEQRACLLSDTEYPEKENIRKTATTNKLVLSPAQESEKWSQTMCIRGKEQTEHLEEQLVWGQGWLRPLVPMQSRAGTPCRCVGHRACAAQSHYPWLQHCMVWHELQLLTSHGFLKTGLPDRLTGRTWAIRPTVTVWHLLRGQVDKRFTCVINLFSSGGTTYPARTLS